MKSRHAVALSLTFILLIGSSASWDAFHPEPPSRSLSSTRIFGHSSISLHETFTTPFHDPDQTKLGKLSGFDGHSADEEVCGKALPRPSKLVDPTTLPDDGSVYQVGTNRWTLEQENHYAAWIRDNASPDFYQKLGIPTDCSKTALGFRLIYARAFNLPMIISNGSEKAGHYLKNWRSLPTIAKWDPKDIKGSYDRDRRFQAYLAAAFGLVDSITFVNNVYPVQISNDPEHPTELSSYIHEGTVMLELTHVRTVSRIDKNSWEPVEELWTSSNMSVKELASGPGQWQYGNGMPQDLGRGIVNWRWAANCGDSWKLYPMKAMPGYSEEQYQWPEFVGDMPTLQQVVESKQGALNEEMAGANSPLKARLVWLRRKELEAAQRAVQLRSANPSQDSLPPSFTEVYQKLARGGMSSPTSEYFQKRIDFLLFRLQDRKAQVLKALELVSQNAQVFQDPAAVEEYSTPSRDQKDLDSYNKLMSLAGRYGALVGFDPDKIKDILRSHMVDVGQGKTINALGYFLGLQQRQVSSDPWAPLDRRWATVEVIDSRPSSVAADSSGRKLMPEECLYIVADASKRMPPECMQWLDDEVRKIRGR
jgi:hypothetical protein